MRQAHEIYGAELDYDQLNSLSYLDAVCREILRLYPPVSFLERVATQDWVLPLLYPVRSKDGESIITAIPVTKGTRIYVSLRAANLDP